MTASTALSKRLRFFNVPDSQFIEKNAYHTVRNLKSADGVLKGINPDFLSSENRFGQAFYLSEIPETTIAELEYHSSIGKWTIRFNFNERNANILDLCRPEIAKKWQYEGGNDYEAPQAIAEKALEAGYNVVRFPSERGAGANLAILNNFENLLTPQMIFPTPQESFVSSVRDDIESEFRYGIN